MDPEFIVAIVAVVSLFIVFPAMVFHYITLWRKQNSLEPDDERMLEDLWRSAKAMERRIENHKVYQARFLDAAGFQCQWNDRATICSISFAALAGSLEHRDRIAAALRDSSIETRPLGGGNMSRQPQWTDRYGATSFPMADRIHTTSLQLPNHPKLTLDDINFICDTVLAVKVDD